MTWISWIGLGMVFVLACLALVSFIKISSQLTIIENKLAGMDTPLAVTTRMGEILKARDTEIKDIVEDFRKINLDLLDRLQAKSFGEYVQAARLRGNLPPIKTDQSPEYLEKIKNEKEQKEKYLKQQELIRKQQQEVIS